MCFQLLECCVPHVSEDMIPQPQLHSAHIMSAHTPTQHPYPRLLRLFCLLSQLLIRLLELQVGILERLEP